VRIERNVPIPPAKRGACGRPRCQATLLAEKLQVGESVLCGSSTEYDTMRARLQRLGRKYVSRKMRDGWRVWRVE
jgi:hypothetical protein